MVRTVTFTKGDIEYTAQIWPVAEGVPYKARVILLHNQGEDVKLYQKLIDRLSQNGYESFYYPRMAKYKSQDEIRREMNRVLKMCIDDIDEQRDLPSHKIHLLGQFIAGAKVLRYGIEGTFRHRIKSIVAINPYIKPRGRTFLNTKAVALRAKLAPKSITRLNINHRQLTSDESWMQNLQSTNYDFSSLCAKEVAVIDDTSQMLRLKSTIAQFSVKNVMIIHSTQDPLSSIKGSEFFCDNVGAESSALLVYDEGRTNLIMETEVVFNKFMGDLISWLEQN